MPNKNFHGKIFESFEKLRKILPVQNGGVVVIKEGHSFEVSGHVLTEEDGNYKRDLRLAKSGTQMLNKDKKVEIILVWFLPVKITNNPLRFIYKGLTPLENI